MKKEVFDKMLNSGEFEQLFNENKINDLLRDGNLSKEQIDKLVDLGKKMSKDEILRRQRDLAKQPGYKEHVLTPLIKKIIAQQGRARDPITGRYIKQETPNQQKAEEQPQEQPQQENPNADRTAERAEQMGQKFKPKRMKNMFSGSRGTTAKPATSKVNTELYSKIGQVQNPRLLKGDNAATVASKLYSIMKNDINEYNVRSKLERKRDKQYLDSEVKRHNEIIAALNRAGGGAGGGSKRTQTGMGIGAKLAIGAGLLGAAALARASEKPTPDVLPPEPKIDPPVPAPSPAPAPAPVPPKVNVEEETRRRQQEAEREAAAQQEKQKREQERQQREAEQKQKEAEQKKAAEEKAAEQEAKKKAEEKQKAAAAEEARKQKEQQEDDKRKAAEAKAKTEREEKERKALADEEKRKKDAAERIAKAEADNQRKEAERLRREEEKTAREETARIKKEREDAEKEADAQKREAALQRKKQAEAIAAEIERQKSQKGDYQPPRNGPRELPYDESIGRRYPKPIVRPTPTAVPQFRTPGEAHRGQQGYTPVPPPAPPPAPSPKRATKLPRRPGQIDEILQKETSKKISEKIAASESAAGSYYVANETFKDKIIDGTKTNIIQKGLINIATGKKFEKDLTEMTIEEVMKLQNERNDFFKLETAGTAIGKYQFVRSTLETQAKFLYGDDWKKVIFNEAAQEELQASLLYENAKYLNNKGISLSEANLYLAHFAGAGGATALLQAKSNDKVVDILNKSNRDGEDGTLRVAISNSGFFSWPDEYFLTDKNGRKTKKLDVPKIKKLSKEEKSNLLKSFSNTVSQYIELLLKGKFSKDTIKYEDIYQQKTYKNRTEPLITLPNGDIKVGMDLSSESLRNAALRSAQVSPPIIIINNETTMLGSTNRSGLSIPTSPDNSAYYPYAA